MEKKSVTGVIGEINSSLRGRTILTLNVPKEQGVPTFAFDLEEILRMYFLGKNVIIAEIDREDVSYQAGLIYADELAKAIGIV